MLMLYCNTKRLDMPETNQLPLGIHAWRKRRGGKDDFVHYKYFQASFLVCEHTASTKLQGCKYTFQIPFLGIWD